MKLLKQSTAKVISFGPFVGPSDGVTLVTSLVSAIDHASTGILLSKNGGALTIRHASVTASTYDAYGNYLVTLDATDTNTLGILRVQFAAAASCVPVWDDFLVVTATVYNSLVATGDLATGVAASVAGAVGSVAGLTASNLDVAVSTRMATYTQPTGFLAAAFPGTVASTTNITAAAGVTLADGAITDAKITFPSESAGRPTTFLAAMRRVWEWACNKRTRDRSGGTVTLFGADNTTAIEAQTQSTTGSTDTQTKGA